MLPKIHCMFKMQKMNEAARKALEEWRASNATTERKNLLEKHKEKDTRTSAINAMCYKCMGGEEDGSEPGIIKEIRNCTDKKCPLHNWRPYK